MQKCLLALLATLAAASCGGARSTPTPAVTSTLDAGVIVANPIDASVHDDPVIGGCPAYYDCMPPTHGECPPPDLLQSCPNTQITY